MPVIDVTLNPNDMNGDMILSNGNLTLDSNRVGSQGNIRATHGKTTGKWYWEVEFISGHSNILIGVANISYPITNTANHHNDSRVYYGSTGNIGSGDAYGTGWVLGDVIGVALDSDNGTLEYYKNGVGMGIAFANIKEMGEVFPLLKQTSTTNRIVTINFGVAPFIYPIPEGYTPYNLETVNKILILQNENEYKKYNLTTSSWETVAMSEQSPTEQEYINNGMNRSYIELIPEDAWRELAGYTISILEYTDDPIQTESVVETETEPFTIYDEFGDAMDVLYYTDDPNIDEAELNITANYSPLDELYEDFEIIASIDEIKKYQKSLEYRYTSPLELPDSTMEAKLSTVGLERIEATSGDVSWNPNDKAPTVLLSNQNFTVDTGQTVGRVVRATEGKSKGKWYWEFTIGSRNNGGIGLATGDIPVTSDIRTSLGLRAYWVFAGRKTSTSTTEGAIYSTSGVTGDIIGVALDLDNGYLEFYKNGESLGVAFDDLDTLGEVYPCVYSATTTAARLQGTVNFGDAPFKYDIPEGYQSYQTKSYSLVEKDSGTIITGISSPPPVHEFLFDEKTGNVLDNAPMGEAVGTVRGGVDRITGWNGEGFSLDFNGTDGYVQFNQPVIPIGEKSIRFKIKKTGAVTGVGEVVLSSAGTTSDNGDRVVVFPDGTISWFSYKGALGAGNERFKIDSTISVIDGNWHDILLTWDGTTNPNTVKVYIDDLSQPNITGTAKTIESAPQTLNFRVGAQNSSTTPSLYFFEGQLDNIEVYDKVIDPENNPWTPITVSNPPTAQEYMEYGITEFANFTANDWNKLSNETDNITIKKYVPEGSSKQPEIATYIGKELSYKALPNTQFLEGILAYTMAGDFEGFTAESVIANPKYDKIGFLLSSNGVTWRRWDGTRFVSVNTADNTTLVSESMTSEELESIPVEEWETWTPKVVYVGIVLDKNIRSFSDLVLNKLEYTTLQANQTPIVSDARMYILNTVSTIVMKYDNSTITGTISDEDEGKVRYRVSLNGEYYYPDDGSFSDFVESPHTLSLRFPSKVLNIDEPNTVRVDFEDYWGHGDYWEETFTGEYSGLVFMDETGQYYSDEMGEVLQYLDFGVITAGQTTIEHKIRLKNSYTYPVNDVHIVADQSAFPPAMKAEFSLDPVNFTPIDEIFMQDIIASNDEVEFFIRLSTRLGETTPTTGHFDIIATAKEVEDAT